MFLFCCAAEEPVAAVDLSVSEALPKKEVHIEEKPAEKQAPEFGSFTVTVPCKDFSSLGLKIDKTSTTMPMIKEVKAGAVEKFNELNPKESIQPFDVLIAWEEATGTDAIWKKMNEKPADAVVLTLSRPRKVEVSLVKTGGLGLKLDYKNVSVGGVIDEIVNDGLMAKWNQTHSSDEVKKGDRIIACNGTEYLGDELLDKIKKTKADEALVLTVLKYQS